MSNRGSGIAGASHRPCRACGSEDGHTEELVEHDCGHVAPRGTFGGPCPKCGQSTPDGTLVYLGTARRCRDCGHRWDPDAPPDGHTGNRPAATPPDLPSSDRPAGWLTRRVVPDSPRGRRIVASLFVLLLLASGITVAVVASTYLQSEEFDPSDESGVVGAGERSWNVYETVVMFRNDDIQGWYEQETLRKVDSVFVETGVPVTHGIVATVGGDTKITDDDRLCEYLRALYAEHPDLFEPANHGYQHEKQTEFYGASEFGEVPKDTQREWLTESDRVLEDCVGVQLETFVAPMNTYDNATVDVLAELGYTAVSGAQWFVEGHYGESSHFVDDGMVHVAMNTNASMVDWTNQNHEYYSLDELTSTFDAAYETNTPYVHMLHYFTFTDEEHYELLREFIDHVKSRDVALMTVGEFVERLRNGEIERADDGRWRVLEAETGQSEGTEQRSDDTAATDPLRGGGQ